MHYKDNTLRCSFQKYLRPGNEDPNFDSSPPEKVFYAGLKEYFLLVAVGQVLDGRLIRGLGFVEGYCNDWGNKFELNQSAQYLLKILIYT